MPSSVLQHMVALPTTRRAWQKAAGQSAQRALLIRAGVGRRREYDAGSQTARALAGLLRREPRLWDIALQATFEHYGDRRRVLTDDDLLSLARDPLAYVDTHPDCPGELAIAVSYALASAEDAKLVRMADVVAARLEALDGATETDEDAERHRIQGLEDLVGTLTKDIKDSERRLRAAVREAQQVKESLR